MFLCSDTIDMNGVKLLDFLGINICEGHVFSPNSKLRKQIVPEKPIADKAKCQQKRYGMSWAQRLKRVFAIEIEECQKCGGKMKVIASIEDPAVIEKILNHLGLDGAAEPHNRSPPTCASGLFDPAATLI